MQRCDFFPPDNKQKLRRDCMIVETTQDEIERALKKQKRGEDANVPTQSIGRLRKISCAIYSLQRGMK